MDDFNVVMGGRTGDGIPEVGLMLCGLLSDHDYYVVMNHDYPSIIVGGHQFVEIRASKNKAMGRLQRIDVLVAFNQDALNLHQSRWHENTLVLYRSDRDQLPKGHQKVIGLETENLLGSKKNDRKMEQMAFLGAICASMGIEKNIVRKMILEQSGEKMKLEHHEEAAMSGYDTGKQYIELSRTQIPDRVVRTGSEAISLGLLQAGLQAYSAYPMTPTSPILEFMAKHEKDLNLQVSLPESEIAVMMQALGYAYMGVRTAVGTSGGGFSLMVEALSLSGQAELPAVIVLGQRAGPGTGMPTYNSQSELSFVLAAGHGEFPRLVVAPGDVEEAFFWSAQALNLAWKYQIPCIVLVDKTLCLNAYSFNHQSVPDISTGVVETWSGSGRYQRYENTSDGISPLAFPPVSGQAVKTNSYVHNEYGLTSEDPTHAREVVEKRFRKVAALAAEIEGLEPVKVTGSGKQVLLTWGSNKGTVLEVAQKLGLCCVQILVMSPFPQKALQKALAGAEHIICIEQNYQGQLTILLQQHGFTVNQRIEKYDGRAFFIEELESEIKKVMK